MLFLSDNEIKLVSGGCCYCNDDYEEECYDPSQITCHNICEIHDGMDYVDTLSCR